MSIKARHQAKLIEFLSDTDNDFISRSELAVTVLGYKNARSMYRVFTPEELTEIEHKALEIRKQQTVRQRANVYTALYKEAIKGNVQACREFLDRTEGKVTDKVDVVKRHRPEDVSITVQGIRPDGTVASSFKLEGGQRKMIEASESETEYS